MLFYSIRKRDIYLNLHSNAREKKKKDLENMKGEVLSLPTFQTSVSHFFFFPQKKHVLLFKIF